MDRLKVYIIGATGLVGQRYVQLLANHPWFEIVGLAASERSAGKTLSQIGWALEEPPPPHLADVKIEKLDVDKIPKVDFVFSALPSEVAAKVEPELAARGHTVVSNASNMRMDPDVPLVVPEINPEDLGLLERQRAERGWRGAVVKKPNCTTTILNLPLKPVLDEWGIERIHVPYGGRTFKIISVLAAHASAELTAKLGRPLHFDGRVVKLKDACDAASYILFRARVGLNNYVIQLAKAAGLIHAHTPRIEELLPKVEIEDYELAWGTYMAKEDKYRENVDLCNALSRLCGVC